MLTLAADSTVLLSLIKPILMLAMVIGWARIATVLDKDAEYFYLRRKLWNAVNLGAGILAFTILLIVPIFWIGIILATMILVGAVVAYSYTRNPHVPEENQWRLDDIKQVFMQKLEERRKETAKKEAKVRFMGEANEFKAVPLPEDEHYMPHLLTEEYLLPMLERDGQRLDFALAGNECVIQLTVDGVGYRLQSPEPAQAMQIIDYLKKQCGLDVEDRRRRQSGTVHIDAQELGTHDLRIQTMGSTRGLTCTIELNPDDQFNIPYVQLGLMASQAEALKEKVFDDHFGVVIVAAPAHQGKTTTLYKLLQQHDPYVHDIHSVERVVEYELEGISQHEMGEEDIATRIQSLLLRDPHILMLAQVDEKTAQLATEAAIDNKRVYAALAATDTMHALKIWLKAVGDPALVARGIKAVIAQRLVRKLCTNCRIAYTPDPEALRKLNLPAEKIQTLYKESGRIKIGENKFETCPVCHGAGFSGRTGVFELMIIDDEGREMVRRGQLEQLRIHLRKQRMLLLQETALAKVVSGVTSISEVMRVLQPEQQQKSQPRQAAQQGAGG